MRHSYIIDSLKWVLPILLQISFSANAQKNCQLKLDKDSIQVYTCNSENLKYNIIKSKFYLHATQQQLKRMLFDIAHLNAWQDQTISASLLKKVNDNEIIYYTEVKAPVVSNRDFVIRLTYHQVSTHEMKFTLISVPDYIPKKKNVVRVPMSKAIWIVKEEKPGRLSIQYALELDLGGTLPVWVINSLSHKAPYDTFKRMKEEIRNYR